MIKGKFSTSVVILSLALHSPPLNPRGLLVLKASSFSSFDGSRAD
jgi:hypothetical protein